MLVSDFQYDLPAERIAQEPLADRAGSRAHPLSPHNPAARDFLRGRIEVLLTRQVADNPNEWECLVRPGRKIGVGEKLYFDGPPSSPHGAPPELEAEVIQSGS